MQVKTLAERLGAMPINNRWEIARRATLGSRMADLTQKMVPKLWKTSRGSNAA